VGANRLLVHVSAEDGTPAIYTLDIYRLSNDTALQTLTVSAGALPLTLQPSFAPNVQSYSLAVLNNISAITLSAATSHARAGLAGIGTRALQEGDNRLQVKVTAEDPAYTATYVVEVMRYRIDDATLRSITPSVETLHATPLLVPAFDPNVTTYKVLNMPDVATLILDASPTNPNATVSDTGRKAVQFGDNPFAITCTAENGSTSRTYTVTVVLSDVSLRTLTATENALHTTPLPLAFDPSTLVYTINVSENTERITIDASATDSLCTVSGTGSKTLQKGVNTFIITVTSPDGYAVRRYAVLVTRPSVSIGLPLDNGDYSVDISDGVLSPNPSLFVTDYTLTLPCGTDTVTAAVVPPFDYSSLLALVTIYFNDEEVQMPLAVSPGISVLKIHIRYFGMVLEYTVTVVNIECVPADAMLKSLSACTNANCPPLSPTFARDEYLYEVDVANETDSITLFAEALDPLATVKGLGKKALHEGRNLLVVEVVARDGYTNLLYTVSVNRKPSDVSLRSLTASTGEMFPDFSPSSEMYAVGVASDTKSIDLVATPNDPNATVTAAVLNGQTMLTGNLRNLQLVDTSTIVQFTVTSANGQSQQVYTVVVVRASADMLNYQPLDELARLRSIYVSPGVLEPAFDPAVGSYSVAVSCDEVDIMVKATPPVGATVVYFVDDHEATMPLRLNSGLTELNILVMVNFKYIARYIVTVSRSLGGSTIIPYWDDVLAVNLNSTSNGGHTFDSYQWYYNGQPLAGETGAYLYNHDQPFAAGKYTVTAVGDNREKFVSCPYIVAGNAAQAATLQVYPNPTVNSVTVEDETISAGEAIKVYDFAGRLLATYPAAGKRTGISINRWKTGAYVVKVRGKSAVIIKQ
jgi:hypothetical protein